MGKTIGPSPLKVSLFYLSFYLLIIIPVVALIIWGFAGPDPYLLDREKFQESWVGKRLKYKEYVVDVSKAQSSKEAESHARRWFDSTSAKSRVKTLNVYRYKRTDNEVAGLILPLGEYVFRIEAADRQKVDKAIEELPYLIKNPEENTLYTLFDKRLGAVFGTIAAYIFLVFLYFAKGGAAAAQIKPDIQARPRMKGDLRAMLLKLDGLDIPFSIIEKSTKELVCEWRLVDEKWSRILRTGGLRINHRITLQLDDENHIVRSVTTKNVVRWEAGLSNFLGLVSWSRNIDFYSYQRETQYGIDFRGGRWQVVQDYGFQFNVNQIRDPVVRLIVESGWVYRPVLGFSLLLR